MSDKIFDLEQQIMSAWSVVDDIDMLYHHFGDDPVFQGLSASAEDEMMNLLLGMKSLYALKFEKLFDSFEHICSEYHKRGKRIEQLQSELATATNRREPFDGDAAMREWYAMSDSIDFVEHEAAERQDKAVRRGSIDEATPEEWNQAFKSYYRQDK